MAPKSKDKAKKKLKKKMLKGQHKKASKKFNPQTGTMKNKVYSKNILTSIALENTVKRRKDSEPIKSFTNTGSNNAIVKKPVSSEERIKEDDRTIFVGNVPKSVNRKNLKKFFSKYGEIDSVRIRCPALKKSHLPSSIAIDKKNFHEKAACVMGYVKFLNKNAVKEALEANGSILDGSPIRVDKVGCNKPEINQHSVFLGNLPFDVAENDVINAFSDCGEIESVRIIRDKAIGVGKGFGYINFKNAYSVDLALKLSGTLVKNRSVRVSIYSKKLGEKRHSISNDHPKTRKSDIRENTSTHKPIKKPKKKKSKLKGQQSETASTSKTMKKPKDKKVKGESFQGLAAKDAVIKKKKLRKKKKTEMAKKKLSEILIKNKRTPNKKVLCL